MISFNGIERWSVFYQLYKYVADFSQKYFYYRKIVVNGADFSTNEPIIFAPNHQNALMDALSVLVTRSNFQPVFLARADIFKKELIARFLKKIKIMPVYRMRDGIENMSNNDEIFEQCVRIIQEKKTLIILPEGNHEGFRQLRPLKKGLARIAFKAADLSKFSLDVKVIPVGLEYSEYNKFRADLIVNFGKPIHIADYKELYEKNQAMAINRFTSKLASELTPLMIHIKSKDNYDTYDVLRKIVCNKMLTNLKLDKSLNSKFKAEKEIISKLEIMENNEPERFSDLKTKVENYSSFLKKWNYKDWLLQKNDWPCSTILTNILLLFVFLPLFLYGFTLNIIPFHIPVRAVRKIKDIQFHSSVKFGLGMHLYLFYCMLLFGLSFIILPEWYYSFLFLISLPISGLLAFGYYKLFRKTIALIRYKKNRKKEGHEAGYELREEILGFF